MTSLNTTSEAKDAEPNSIATLDRFAFARARFGIRGILVASLLALVAYLNIPGRMQFVSGHPVATVPLLPGLEGAKVVNDSAGNRSSSANSNSSTTQYSDSLLDASSSQGGFPFRYYFRTKVSARGGIVPTWFSWTNLAKNLGIGLLLIAFGWKVSQRSPEKSMFRLSLYDILFVTMVIGISSNWMMERGVFDGWTKNSRQRSSLVAMTRTQSSAPSSMSETSIARSLFESKIVVQCEMIAPKPTAFAQLLRYPFLEKLVIDNAESIELPEMPGGFPFLQGLECQRSNVRSLSHRWKELANSIQWISFQECTFDGMEEDPFPQLQHLKHLDLVNSKVPPDWILSAAKLPELTTLVLDESLWSPELAQAIEGHRTLREIVVAGQETRDKSGRKFGIPEDLPLFSISLQNLPALKLLGLPTGHSFDIQLVNLPMLSELAPISSEDILVYSNAQGVAIDRRARVIHLDKSSVKDCPRFQVTCRLNFSRTPMGRDEIHSHDWDSIGAGTQLDLSLASPWNTSENRANDFDAFLDGLPPVVEGGKIRILGCKYWSENPDRFEQTLAKLPAGLKGLDFEMDHDFIQGSTLPSLWMIDLPALPPPRVMSSVESSRVCFLISASQITEFLHRSPKLKDVTLGCDIETSCVVMDHPSMESLTVYTSGGFNYFRRNEPLSMEIAILRCPKLQRIQLPPLAAKDRLVLVDLPRLDYDANAFNYNQTVLHVEGIRLLKRLNLDPQLYCGNLRNDLKASDEIVELLLNNPLLRSQLLGILSDHGNSLQKIQLWSETIDRELAEGIRDSRNQFDLMRPGSSSKNSIAVSDPSLTLAGCRIDMDALPILFSTKFLNKIDMSGCWLVDRDADPEPSVDAVAKKLSASELQFIDCRIDPKSAAWLAQRVSCNSLTVRDGEVDLASLLPVLETPTGNSPTVPTLSTSTFLLDRTAIDALARFPRQLTIHLDAPVPPKLKQQLAKHFLIESSNSWNTNYPLAYTPKGSLDAEETQTESESNQNQ